MEMNTETLSLILGALLAISEVLAKTSLKSNSVFELVWNMLKKIKSSNFLPVLLAVCLLGATACSTVHNKPTQPGEVLAAIESDYTSALLAAKEAYDAGALSPDKVERIDKLVLQISPMLDRAEVAFVTGQSDEGNKWVNMLLPLVADLVLEVTQ